MSHMEDIAESVIDRALTLGAEFVDLRMESLSGTSIIVMDGRTKTVNAKVEKGCGVRAFIDGGWGFSVCNGFESEALKAIAESAVKLAKVSRDKAKVRFKVEAAPSVRTKDVYPCRVPPSSIAMEDKVKLVLDMDKAMGGHDSRIVSRNARYTDMEGDRVVANSFGSLIRTRENWSHAACSAWAKEGVVLQRGYDLVGNVGGYELMQTEKAGRLGETAASQAIKLLDSEPVPAGKFTCILDNRMTGMLAHEAFGHACEADAILAGSSVLDGMHGEKVAHESVTLVDDATVQNTFGYFAYDWEGVRSEKHVLIDKGVLTGYLHSLETSSRMGIPPNGAARSEAYFHPPVVRMSNTYIAPGTMKKDELIEDVRDGILVKGSQYGYVEPAKGQFMFKCEEAYRVTEGEVGQRYRDTILSGLILEVLNNVTGVADDFELVDPGYCGKAGQAARTTDGGPHIRVDDVVVGGLA